MDSNIKLLITEEQSELSTESLNLLESAGFTPIFCQRDGEEVLRLMS